MASMGVEENPFAAAGEFAMLNPKMMRHGFSRTRLSPDIDGNSDVKLADFDDADKDLEAVQNLCEVGAHQFLREGDCRLEIEGMRKKFESVLEVARKEVEKLKLEEENETKGQETENEKEKETKEQETETEKKEDLVAEQPKENSPTVHIVEKKLEPSLEMPPPLKQINFTGTGTIEVDDGSDAESVHIDLSAFRRTRRL